MEKFSICFCALDDKNCVTEFYIFPVSEDDDSFCHPSRISSTTASASASAHILLPVGDTENTPPRSRLIRLLSRLFVSPRLRHGFTLIGSKLYILGSHIFGFPEGMALDEVRVPKVFHGDCGNEFGVGYMDNTVVCPASGRHFFHCDLENTEIGWEIGPLMRVARSWHTYCIAVDGKIHVVGGNHPIHEVFDPLSKQWTALAPPPPVWHEDTRNITSLSAVIDNPRRILVGSTMARYFYIYDVMRNSWRLMSVPKCNRPQFLSGPAAVAGNTLYWFDYRKYRLVAFDLDQQKWLRGRVRGLDDEECFGSTRPFLLHLSDNLFCILWTSSNAPVPVFTPRNLDSDSEDSDYYANTYIYSSNSNSVQDAQTQIHCAKVRVSKVVPHIKGKHGLSAFVESSQYYLTDSTVSSLGAFLMENNERSF